MSPSVGCESYCARAGRGVGLPDVETPTGCFRFLEHSTDAQPSLSTLIDTAYVDWNSTLEGAVMEWWVWIILVVVALVAVLAFFEWRSRNKPLSRGLQGQRHTPGHDGSSPPG